MYACATSEAVLAQSRDHRRLRQRLAAQAAVRRVRRSGIATCRSDFARHASAARSGACCRRPPRSPARPARRGPSRSRSRLARTARRRRRRTLAQAGAAATGGDAGSDARSALSATSTSARYDAASACVASLRISRLGTRDLARRSPARLGLLALARAQVAQLGLAAREILPQARDLVAAIDAHRADGDGSAAARAAGARQAAAASAQPAQRSRAREHRARANDDAEPTSCRNYSTSPAGRYALRVESHRPRHRARAHARSCVLRERSRVRRKRASACSRARGNGWATCATSRTPASLSPRTLLPGLLDEPLLLARDAGGCRCAASPTCARIARNLLVDAPCRAADIRCGYHSRRFDLAGRMTFMPEFADARDFPTADDDLPQVPFARVGRARLRRAFARSRRSQAFVDDMIARDRDRCPAAYAHDPARDRDYEIAAHWALYVENYLEGFHIPVRARGPRRRRSIARRYTTELFALREPAAGRWPATGEPAFERNAASRRATTGWIFPNLMLNFYPWGLSVNLVEPQSPVARRVRFRSYVRDAALRGGGAGGALDRVEQEDEAIVEAVRAACARASIAGAAAAVITPPRTSAASITSTGCSRASSRNEDAVTEKRRIVVAEAGTHRCQRAPPRVARRAAASRPARPARNGGGHHGLQVLRPQPGRPLHRPALPRRATRHRSRQRRPRRRSPNCRREREALSRAMAQRIADNRRALCWIAITRLRSSTPAHRATAARPTTPLTGSRLTRPTGRTRPTAARVPTPDPTSGASARRRCPLRRATSSAASLRASRRAARARRAGARGCSPASGTWFSPSR